MTKSKKAMLEDLKDGIYTSIFTYLCYHSKERIKIGPYNSRERAEIIASQTIKQIQEVEKAYK